MALTNAPVEGADVHPLDKIDHDRLSIAEEGALEVSEHLERKSREATSPPAPAAASAAAATRRSATRKTATAKKTTAARTTRKTASRKTASVRKRGAASKRTASVASRRSSSGGERARDVAAELLKKAGGEMAVADLAAKVVSSGRTRLGGKTPAATVAAQIYTAAKSGVLFKKTSRGRVALLKAKA